MRTIVISGGSSGIGWATATRFATGGDRVFNLDVRPPEQTPHSAITWIDTDISDWSAVRTAVAHAADSTGRVDVAIANAGISLRRSVLELAEADARRVVDVNLLGVLGMWQAAAAVMLRQRSGVLLATASVNGARGYPFYADYNATKAGIMALCRTFALELSPWIRAACVSPGAVLTPMQLAEYTPEMLDDVNAKIPAGRHAKPEEVASAFHYLASEDASFLTGQELVIDGAETAGATTAVFGTGAPLAAAA